jgi:hypothetical protein
LHRTSYTVISQMSPMSTSVIVSSQLFNEIWNDVYDLMDGLVTGTSPAATFEYGYRCQAVLDAVERSAERREWTRPEYGGL